jgi:hypothetical protein
MIDLNNVIEFLKEYDYAFLLVGAFLLIWLYWLPKVLAPILIKRYDGFPPSIKAFVQLLLPTIEKMLLDCWDATYKDTIEPIYKATPTELDDNLWKEIDKMIQSKLDKEMLN